MDTYKKLPDYPALVGADVFQIATARQVLEAAGGATYVLTRLASGEKMIRIAKDTNLTIAQIDKFLRATCDPADIEAAMVSQIRTRVEKLDDAAADIEDASKRIAAKKELLFWQAEKETEKYRSKQADALQGGITIKVDWSQFEPAQPAIISHVDV